ncbi:hypothetical protein GG344DRAFT_51437 [Lentinula edodes]|nr:hypothetical protein GG344DRAFT_51437 [Lentinula edodes]
MCYLDILDNLPRLRLSSSQLKIFLWIMRACGAKDVPSFKALRQAQKKIREDCSVRVQPSKSDFGNLFYTTDIRDIMARDLANPEVAPLIHVYPEDVNGSPISEMWQVPKGRWMELPLDFLTPSILVDNKRHYIHEVAQLKDHQWVIPKMWITQAGEIFASCHVVNKNERGLLTVKMDQVRVSVKELHLTYMELVALNKGELIFEGKEAFSSFASQIPNCNRAIDNGEDLFTVWLAIWMDDVSGARSKQYQKHVNAYAQISNLPGKFLQHEYSVHFVSTSPFASALEQFKPIVKQLQSTHTEPVRCFNASTKRPCSLRGVIPDCPADNPQQAEESSHIGGSGNCKCRSCLAGGENGFHATVENYHDFYECGKPRSVQEIRDCVLEQIRLATYGVSARVEELQTRTGTKDKIAQRWIDILIKEARRQQGENPEKSKEDISEILLLWLASQTDQPYNPLLDVDFFDPSQDTLVEILHTILLGTEKYVWHGLHSSWSPEQQDIFTVRLQSTNTDGLLVPPIRAAYMMQYRNGLIGKHFKTLMQTMIFHVHGLVTSEQMTLLRTTGELGALLWISEIADMEEYIIYLEVLIGNVLDAFASIDPSKILVKVKLHTIIHIPSNIRRRGPGARFSTEVYECFNGIFRMCSVLSNHQAPSRDIAHKFSDLECVKHLVSGGYWCNSEGRWVQAGNEVRLLLRQTPIFQKHLGWSPKPEWVPGFIKRVLRAKTVLKSLSEMEIPGAYNPCHVDLSSSSKDWTNGIYTTAVSGDQCRVGSFGDTFTCLTRIQDILLQGNHIQGLIVVEEFKVLEALHPTYLMPVTCPSGRRFVVPSQTLQFVVNVQHDCRGSNCQASGTTKQKQERQQLNITVKTIQHVDDQKFIINTHALHNAHHLRRFLPRYLTVPRPLYPDRKQWHRELAGKLVVSQVEKRAETNRKAAETRAKNAAAKNSGAGLTTADNREVQAPEGRKRKK